MRTSRMLKKGASCPSSGLRTCSESLGMSGKLAAAEGLPLTLRLSKGESNTEVF